MLAIPRSGSWDVEPSICGRRPESYAAVRPSQSIRLKTLVAEAYMRYEEYEETWL